MSRWQSLLVLAAVWTVVIPDHCIEPMLRVYEQRIPWAMQAPYEQLVSEGHLDLGGCTIGFDPQADVLVPLDAPLKVFELLYQRDQSRGTLTGWLDTFLRHGRVLLPGDILVRREG